MQQQVAAAAAPPTTDQTARPADRTLLRFDRSTATLLQSGSWQCSAASAAWMLRSIGLSYGQDDVVALLGPARISTELGLLSWRGDRLCEALNGVLGRSGLSARWFAGQPDGSGRFSGASWGDVAAVAGRSPAMFCLTEWNHWSGLRDVDGDQLLLANPSPRWWDIGQDMSRREFEGLGRAAIVWIAGAATAGDRRRTWSRAEIVELSNRLADEFGIPRLAMLGCAFAESGLRCEARRPVDAASDPDFWPDVSAGVWQQTVRFTPEYARLGFGGAYPGPEVTRRILDAYCDPAHAGRTAAPQIRHYLAVEGGDILRALCRYNWPAREPNENPNRGNYERGLADARAVLEGRPA
jgi:hypothetical protein